MMRVIAISLFFLWGHDENFYEWASAKITWLELTLDWRPTDKLRFNGFYPLQYVGRRTDGSTVDVWRSPRLKVEYQLSRPIFLRLVGEYTNERRDALRDDTRTNAPILILDPASDAYVRTTAFGRGYVDLLVCFALFVAAAWIAAFAGSCRCSAARLPRWSGW